MNKIYNKDFLKSLVGSIDGETGFFFKDGGIIKAQIGNTKCFVYSKKNQKVSDIFNNNAHIAVYEGCETMNELNFFEQSEGKTVSKLIYKGRTFFILGDFNKTLFNDVSVQDVIVSSDALYFLDIHPDYQTGTVAGYYGDKVKTVFGVEKNEHLYQLCFSSQNIPESEKAS